MVLWMGTAALTLASCGKDDEEDPVSLEVSRESITFAVTQGDIQHFTISCNTAWSISGQPDWLDMWPNAGKGTTTVELKTLTNNINSSKPRTATLVVTAGDKQATISLVQEAGLASNCSVRPNEVTTLRNGIAFDCSYDPDVSFFYTGWLKASEVASMTEAEIIATLEGHFTRRLPSDDPIVVFDELQSGTEYMVYTLGYTKEGTRGDLYSEKVSTNKELSNEPLALISSFSGDEEYWYFSTTRSGTCAYYYMLSTQKEDTALQPDVFQAWMIDNAIRQGEFESAYTSDARWRVPLVNSLIAVWTRGYNTNNVASGVITWRGIQRESSTSTKRAVKNDKPTQKIQFLQKPATGSYKVYRMD